MNMNLTLEQQLKQLEYRKSRSTGKFKEQLSKEIEKLKKIIGGDSQQELKEDETLKTPEITEEVTKDETLEVAEKIDSKPIKKTRKTRTRKSNK